MISGDRSPRLERVGFELRATGLKPAQMSLLRSGIHTRGYLPHVKREGARYFVTFRLADSLPIGILGKFQAERSERLARLYAEQAAAEKLGMVVPVTQKLSAIERDYFRKVETYLDRGQGACWLRRPDIAGIAAGAIRFFDGDRYILKSWVIMPNHVHAVFWPMPNHTLSAICQSWKRYIAREANKLLNRTGEAFWQPEPFDHWIRNDVENDRCCRYVVYNPVKARLCSKPQDWRWSSAWTPTKH